MDLLTRIKTRFSRPYNPSDEPATDTLPFYYMQPDGRVQAVKSSTSYSRLSLYDAYSSAGITSEPEGYAYAYVVSVWAYRCVELRANTLNRLEWKVQNRKTQKEIPNHPLTVAIRQNRQRLIRKHEWSKLIWGETFFWILENESRFIKGLRWLNNLYMQVDTTTGRIGPYLYTPQYGGTTRQLPSDQVVFFRTDNPFDELRGLSLFETIMLEVGIDRDISRVTKSWYSNDARPGLLLFPEHDLAKGQGDELIDKWKANFQGPKNAGKPVIVPKVIKDVKEINRAPNIDDMELRASTRREICAAFGVPLSIAGAWDDAQYQSAPEQRRSFYEETILPEGEEISTDWTEQVLPLFDDSGENELVFNADKIMALTENALEKVQVANSKLVSGGITLNQYRKEIGQGALKNGDVFYVPSGVTRVPVEQIGEPTPVAPQPTPFGMAVERPAPNELPTAQLPAPQQPKALPAPQPTPEAELKAWEKKALNNGAVKAQRFQVYTLPAPVELLIRKRLTPDLDKSGIRSLFALANRHLTKKKDLTPEPQFATPEDYQAYWQRYDTLLAAVGNIWLTDYMAAVWKQLEPRITDASVEISINSLLAANHPALTESWVGTAETPGVLSQLMLAGMAAGDEALHRSIPNPNKAVTIDWSLVDADVLDYVRTYVDGLIRRLDDTTREAVRKALLKWIEAGQPLADLKEQLNAVFHNPVRAEIIAQTESTRAYAEGAFNRWERAGVTQAKWQTVQDSDVCPICRGLHNVSGDFRTGWIYEGNTYTPPAHSKCRCFARPVMA